MANAWYVWLGLQTLAAAAFCLRALYHTRSRALLPMGLLLCAIAAALSLEFAAQVFAKIGLGAAKRRAVVVGQVKVGDAEVKRGAQHLALRLHGCGVAKVVPQAQRDGGQFQAASTAGAVGHGVVALRVSVVVHVMSLVYFVSKSDL